MVEEKNEKLGKALGRIVSGIAIVTAKHQGQRSALLGSWFQQVSFDPPTISIAVNKERPILGIIQEEKHFCINILSQDQKQYLGHFGRGFKPGEDPFDQIEIKEGKFGSPILTEALSYLECEVKQSLDLNDHVLIVAEVKEGDLQDLDSEPMVHIRKNGFNY